MLRTYRKSRPSPSFVGRALIVGFLILIASAAFAQSAAVEAFNAMGFQKNRNYFSPEPYEHYDSISGNVLLTFIDLTLPGNAGRSLQFQRTFNNQRSTAYGQTTRWTFGLAGMVMRIWERPLVPEDFDFNNDNRVLMAFSPILITADGALHSTIPAMLPDTSSDESVAATTRVVLSGDFLKYDRQTHTLYMPDGTVCHYEQDGVAPDGQPLLTLTSFEDAYGNTVVFSSPEPGVVRVTQSLSDTQSRYVDLTIDVAKRVQSMTFNGHTWLYGYEELGGFVDITSVTLPIGGPGWTFTYGSGIPDLAEITTPNGGRIEYTWVDVLVDVTGNPSEAFLRHFLQFRKSYDRGSAVPLGTWELTWGNGQPDPFSWTSSIKLPSGASVGFSHGELQLPNRHMAGGFGVVARSVASETGQVLESEEIGYDIVPVVRHTAATWFGTPELSERTVIRGTRSYSTQWVYDTSTASAASFPWNNHNPTSIVENNNEGLGRTWTRTYTNFLIAPGATTLAPYLLGLPATEQVTVSTDAFKRTWAYTNPMFPGFLTQYTGFARPTATGIVKTFVPASRGNVETVTTATSSTSYSYEWGVVKDTTTAAHTISREINIDGTVQSETVAGRQTLFEYDPLGRQTLVTPPGGTNPTTTVYPSNGESITTTRGTTPQTTSSLTTYLDGFGRPTGTLNSQGVRTTTRYDAEGRVTYRGLPFLGSADVGTTITYDGLDRVIQEAHVGGAHRDYTYSADTTTIVDEEGRETEHRFVAFGHPDDARLTIVTDAKDQPWAYAYDVLGRIRNVTAPDEIARTWEYNDQALLFRETHPESGVTTYEHNAGGLLVQKTDAKGQTFVYTYDGNDRVRTITVGSELTTFTYEPGSDNRKSMDVDGVHTEFGYDTAGRRASRVDMVDGFKFTTTFGYDNNDNLTSISYPSFGSSGNRRQIGYEYDSERRLKAVRDLLVTRNFATNIDYHPSGALVGYTAGNGVTSTFNYDPNRYWMTSLSVGSHWSLQYQNYDAVGNVRSLVDSRAGMNQDLDYDELDRLWSVSAGPGYPSAQYAYDVHGNRADAYGTTYTYYPGKLRLWTQNTDTYTYDNNGNLLTATTPGRTFTYTAWNRVASATMGGTTTNYRYDADDWRVKKSSGATTTYLLRGLNGELLTEWKNPGSSGTTRDYVYAGSRLIAALGRPWNEVPADYFGHLTMNGPPTTVNLTQAGHKAWLTFDAEEGRLYSVFGQTVSGYCMFFPFTVLKPDGNEWKSTSSCGNPFFDREAASMSGTYTVIVDPTGTSTGTVKVSVYDITDLNGGQMTMNGPFTSVVFTRPGQKANLSFAAVEGRRYSFLGETVSGYCMFWPLTLTRPNGTQWKTASSCGNPFFEPDVAPESGPYTVLVDPTGPSTGTVKVTVYDIEDIAAGPITLNGAAVPASLTRPGQKATFTFSGVAGHRYSVYGRILTSGCLFWPFAVSKPTGGPPWKTANNCGNTFFEPDVAPEPGTYTVLIDPNGAGTGNVDVSVYDVVDLFGSLTVNAPAVPVSITQRGQVATYTFAGSAGQQVTVRLTGNTIGTTVVNLFRPDLSLLTTNWSPSDFNLATQTLASDGIYTVVVDPSGANMGNISVRVTSP